MVRNRNPTTRTGTRPPLNDPATDGRRVKGERRRRALIDAALRVVEREGVAAVTHRAVAREAGVPTSAATYYFSGVDDLLVSALTSNLDADSARLQELTRRRGEEDTVRALAELMAEIIAAPERARLRAEFELCLLASRRSYLRDSTDRWQRSLAEFARGHTSDPVRIRMFPAAYDGLLLHGLITSTPLTADEFEETLRVLLGLATPPAG